MDGLRACEPVQKGGDVMPTYREIATALIPTDQLSDDRATLPIGLNYSGTREAVFYAAPGDGTLPVADRASDLWGFWKTHADPARGSPQAFLLIPEYFQSDGRVFNFQDAIEQMGSGTYRLTIGGARDDGTDLIVTINAISGEAGTGDERPILFPFRLVSDGPRYVGDNHGSDTGGTFIGGRRLTVEYQPEGEDAFINLMPRLPVRLEKAVWVTRTVAVGDFTALAIDGAPDAETIATRQLTLETAYDLALEDGDVTIVYEGAHWRIVSTDRTEEALRLNLSVNLV